MKLIIIGKQEQITTYPDLFHIEITATTQIKMKLFLDGKYKSQDIELNRNNVKEIKVEVEE